MKTAENLKPSKNINYLNNCVGWNKRVGSTFISFNLEKKTLCRLNFFSFI